MNVLERFANLIFPPKCIFCNTLMDIRADLHICAECYKKIPFMGHTFLKLDGSGTEKGCDAALSICRYTGIIKHSLIRYKFYNKPGYYRAFAKLMTKYIFKVTNSTKFDIIISVPLHRNREVKRGYNQALLISKALAGATGIRECSRLITRTRNTGAQSLLDKKGRLENLKDAFCVTHKELIKGKNILLIDDILTTGTTVNECGRILKKAGANTVIAAVIATGQAL